MAIEHNIIPPANMHAVYSATYASEAARITAAASLVASTDVGRIVFQTDVGSSWIFDGAVWRHMSGPRPLHTVAGTAYTVAQTDLDATLETTGSSAVTITLPAAASGWPKIGDAVEFIQGGTGLLTIAHALGTGSIKSSGTLVSKGQYAFLAAKYISADLWFVTGDRA